MKGVEIRPLVIDVDTFAAFQQADNHIGYRRQRHLPAHLQHPLGDEHLEDEIVGPPIRAPESERVEKQAVDALPDDRRSDRAGLEMPALVHTFIRAST